MSKVYFSSVDLLKLEFNQSYAQITVTKIHLFLYFEINLFEF